MKFGIQHPNFSYDYPRTEVSHVPLTLKNLITTVERFGYDSFWLMDHFHQIPVVGSINEPMLEGWTTLSYLAALTSNIKIGTLVTGNIYRYPSILAKIGATLDVLSSGRLIMGIGAAWNQEESLAYGINFPSNKDRFSMLEEAVQIIKKMWNKDENQSTFNGKFYRLHDAYCNPKPIQDPMPLIMIGGSGERKTLKLVAKYADACNIFGSPKTISKKLAVLKDHCMALNRDFDAILKTKLAHVIIDNDKDLLANRLNERFRGVPQEERNEFVIYGTPEQIISQIQLFADSGIEYLIVNFEPGREVESLDLFATKVMRYFTNT
ncbi:MAG TPA: LLM class F420-dependent oxidoreductase [Nitrososphaeraceae archaeon]|nr:LLM class F420-dependent oxidoreductase [Nitrososphaeraceae archaeon]